MNSVLQFACVCLFVQVALAVKGPVPEDVCDAICPIDNPIVANVHLPYTDDCTKFCHCANDGNWMKNCPAELHFNPTLMVCDWPYRAGCPFASTSSVAPTATPSVAPTTPTSAPSTPTPTATPTAAPTASPANVCKSVCPPTYPIDANLHLAHPVDPHKFCHCANDGQWEKDCAGGLVFNPILAVCDWPYNV
ncbi:peritrophin-1-like [Atheta coriaria]|uniref:peritrophin-1-like n=1 Tax=Dalotia coriaria TaxID=877792 RepID=UPI0031F34D31